MTKTLYERLGGEDAIAAVVDEFYDRVMADGQVAGYFDDVDMQNSGLTRPSSSVRSPAARSSTPAAR